MKVHESFKIDMDMSLSAKERRRLSGEFLRKKMQENLFYSVDTNQSIYKTLTQSMDYYGKKHNVIENLDRSMINYGKLNLMLHGIGYLTSKITKKSEYVGVLLPNTSGCAAVFLGLSAYGRVPAMLNYTMSQEAFKSCLKSVELKTIISSKEFIEKGKFSHLIDAAKDVGVNVVYAEDLKANISFIDKLNIKNNAIKRYHESCGGEDHAVVLYTSGSEGTPKGVVLSHRALLSNIAQIRAVIDIMFEDKVCNVLPMFHSFGLTAGTLLPLISGTKLLLYVSPLHYKVVPELIYDRNCTVMFGTNTFLLNYAKKAHSYDFHKIRYVVASAEKVSDVTRNIWFEKFGLRILEGYGATECSPVIAVNTPMANKFGTVGQFLPAISTKLESVSGIENGGKLYVKCPNLMSGYFKEDKPGKLQEVGEWYDTGDIVEIDKDGFVTIKGRVKRFVKIAGEMVSLETVDKIISQTTDLLFATTSKSDINKGEQIVVFTMDKNLNKEKIKQAIANSNQYNLMLPNEIRYTDSIPFLGSGKIDYQKLKQLV